MNRRHPLKRPLYVVGISFGLALLFATVVGFHVALIGATLCALLFLLTLAVRGLRQYEGVTAALLAACAAFAMFSAWEYGTVQPLQQMGGRTVTLTMWIEEEVGETERSLTYFGRVREGDLPENTRLLLRVSNGSGAPQIYDRVEAEVQLEATDDWRSENVFLSAWINDCTVTVSEERPWDHTLQKWRTGVLRTVETKADGDVAALLRAVCFGDKTQLSDTVKENFSAAGLSHITAVSGFHMSIVSLGLFYLLRRLVSRRWAAVLSLPVPLLFATLTGFSYSAMRAGVMTCLMLLATVFRREADGRNSLGGAVLCLLALDMTAVYDLGLQLSVAATWGILVASSLQPKTKPNRWQTLGRGLQLTVAAVAATLPLSALNFGEISVLSPLTNLIAQPLAAVIVSTGCVGTLLLSVPFLSFVGTPLILAAGVAARGLLWIGEVSASLPFAFLRLDEPYLIAWAMAVPFALMLGWFLLKKRGLRMTAMLLVIAFCASTLVFQLGMRGVTELTMTNVTDGAVILFARDGHYAAVVTGDPSSKQVQSVLARQGVEQLDVVLYTTNDTAAVEEAVTVETVFSCPAETWSSTAVTVTLWENTTLWWQDGWCRLALGEKAVLIAPCDGTAAVLPTAFKTADIAVFDRDPPQHAETLALGRVVFCCSEEALPKVTRELLWGVYPIEVTADETVTIRVR